MYQFAKVKVGVEDFIKGFDELGLSDRFSDKGLEALYHFFHSHDIEFDASKICSEWTEYGLIADMIEDHPELSTDPEVALDQVRDATMVLPISCGFVVENF